MKIQLNIIIGLLVAFLVFNAVVLTKPIKESTFSGVTEGNAYDSNTSSSTVSTLNVLRGKSGTFGTYIVTKAGASGGWVNFYDATTSDATLRGNSATTTIARFPTDLAVGSYIFDSVFYKGLLMENDARQGTTTWTYR